MINFKLKFDNKPRLFERSNFDWNDWNALERLEHLAQLVIVLKYNY